MIRPEPGGDETRLTPTSEDGSPWDTYGTPVQPEPAGVDERPTRAVPIVGAYSTPTVIQPAVPVAAPAVIAPIPPEPLYVQDNRPPWVVIAAVLALLVGGLVGFLIGHSSAKTGSSIATTGSLAAGDQAAADQAADRRVNDIFTLLAAQARQPGGIQTPTPYPSLDDLLGVLGTAPPTAPTSSAAAGTVESLTAERDQLAAQVATLQGELAASQTLIDQLQQTAGSGGTPAGAQAQIDQQAQQISSLQNDLASTTAKLDQATTSLQTVQGQLDAANKTLAGLDPKPVENLVGQDVGKARSTAKTNGWTLVEQPIESATAAVGTVTTQAPAAGANMIKGSVLYVEVATAPGSP